VVRVSLKDFAATGDFGPVRAGFTAPGLEAVLGPPEATGGTSRRQRRPVAWKYGDIEFHFARPDGTLCLIHLDRFSAAGGCPAGWGELEIEPWVIKEGLPRDAFLAAIEEAGLKYAIRPEPQYNQEVVVLASGIEVGFLCRPEPHSPPVGLAWLSRRLDRAKPGRTADRGRDPGCSQSPVSQRGRHC
jgi:hypothetical protein